MHAVYADYQGTKEGIQSARLLLDALKQSALEEQATDFDPSGSSGDAVRSSSTKPGADEVESNAEDWVSQTAGTECTSFSNEISTLSLGESSGSGSESSWENGCFKESEHFDTPAKQVLLAETFPTLRFDFIAHVLKKSDDNLSKATDELLNHVYFEDVKSSPTEEIGVARGIDAFSEEYHVPHRGKKSKNKRKQKGSSYYPGGSAAASESDVSPPPSTNKWQNGNRDVDFIASKTKLPAATIFSLYHKNGASMPATIMALIDKDLSANKNGKEPDAGTIQGAIELTSDFPNMDLEYAVALIRLTTPSTAHAHELAKALMTQPATSVRMRGGIEVIPRYAPINLSDPTEQTRKLPSLPPSALPQTSASLATARSAAFTQASDAYRRGKSTPLMKAAAGYYSQVGRDLNANLKAANEYDADALVSSQSSPTSLDLHGVSVQSATRIAKERTRAWWDNLGEARIPGGGRHGAGDGYRIITGLGRHSEGGRGKIGPAVVRALVKEGWKIEVGTGELVVTGLVRKK